MDDSATDIRCAEIPDSLDKGLRACLRCSLIKTYEQFLENGCENCDFLNMADDKDRVNECTTAYFEGTIAMMEPNGSWVAKWQRIGHFEPGLYAVEVSGELPEDAIEHCENFEKDYRAKAKKGK